MNIGRINQIEEIYHAALKIPKSEREIFFEQLCGTDFNLRREVKSLLAFEKTPVNFLDSPPEISVIEIIFENEAFKVHS